MTAVFYYPFKILLILYNQNRGAIRKKTVLKITEKTIIIQIILKIFFGLILGILVYDSKIKEI